MMSGIVKIHGKEYKTVALRVSEFREKYGNSASIMTEVVRDLCVDGFVVVQAKIVIDSVIVATGLAEEKRGSTQINKTSALENCETSAIGRALACLGFGGTEYASANEVQNAIGQQEDEQEIKSLKRELMGAHKELDMLSNFTNHYFKKEPKNMSLAELREAVIITNALAEEEQHSHDS